MPAEQMHCAVQLERTTHLPPFRQRSAKQGLTRERTVRVSVPESVEVVVEDFEVVVELVTVHESDFVLVEVSEFVSCVCEEDTVGLGVSVSVLLRVDVWERDIDAVEDSEAVSEFVFCVCE